MKMISKKHNYLYLFIIILVQILILVHYINIKTIPYVDEIWTYGLANSKNKPFLYDTLNDAFQGDGFVFDSSNQLFNRWIDGNYYLKYITVQPSERFDFENVYENITLDIHPPFYYFLLHFICSFFPNKFSLWFGYSINIIFLFLTQLIIYKLCILISKKESWALINCIFFALSMGAVNAFIYIRMYCVLSFFYLSITYLAIIVCLKGNITKLDFIKVVTVSFLGFLTDNQFYYYVIALTLSCFVYIIYKRNYKLLLEYAASGILCLLLFWNYFPWIFIQAERFNNQIINTWKVSNFLLKPFPIDEILLNFSIMNNYILGLDINTQLELFKYVKTALSNFTVYFPVWLSILLFLTFMYYIFLRSKGNKRYFILLSTFFIYAICLASNTFYNRTYHYLGLYTFSILPCFSLIFLSFYKYIVFKYVTRKKLQYILFWAGFLIFVLASHYNSNRIWFCDYKPGTEKICDFLKDKSVIYIVDSNILVDNLIHAKPWDFMKAKRVFASRSHNIKKILKEINRLSKNDDYILFLPNSPKGEYLYNKIMEQENITYSTFIGIDNDQYCSFYMFRLQT